MSARSPLPAGLEVRELVEGLLGRDVDVTLGAKAVDPAEPGGAIVGVYVDAALTLKALVIVDLSFAAHSGAAIALVPVHAARAAVEGGLLTPALYENAAEILNVAASLFNHEGAPHVRLYEAYAPRETLPPDVAQWVLAYVRRLDVEIAITGYDSGRMSVLAL
jgi:hypothetical protein